MTVIAPPPQDELEALIRVEARLRRGVLRRTAPHQLDSYLGAWTLGGPQVAYFTGSCPVCGAGPLFETVSLWVTKNGGRTFRRYAIPSLDGYSPSGIRVSGHEVTVFAMQVARGARPRKTATVHVD